MQTRHEAQGPVNPTTYAEYRSMHIAIIGLGVTGLACLRFLLDQGAKVSAFDQKTIDRSELLSRISRSDLGLLDSQRLAPETCFETFDLVVLSPGVNPSHPAIAPLMGQAKLISDLDLFARHNSIPCIGVTGSNGKSTVVDMLQKALQASGKTALLGGNFGTSAIDLLNTEADYIVLELSSFQLQISQCIPLAVACILNVTEDHIDRHGSLENYQLAKQRIFEHAGYAVFNREDAATLPQQTSTKTNSMKLRVIASVGLQQVEGGQQFWQDKNGIYVGKLPLIRSADLKMPLSHMMLNMQFVLAILKSLDLSLDLAIDLLKEYQGLAHRFELVREDEQVVYINDSKATNPGACLAAIECAKNLHWNIILIAGGDAKGADLNVLQNAINRDVTLTLVFGKDAEQFIPLLERVKKVNDLSEAIALAEQSARQQSSKTAILLSPACASTDMFENYSARGEAFCRQVLEIAA
jgi:UDP-N-acetylmuramoylalanine--D-glutamate ligase